jgi:RNA polymerase sigma-70 factor (sigma-E family)
MNSDLEVSFRVMAEVEMHPLRRFARSLTRDPHRADDLVQGALERMFVVWPQTHSVTDPGAYLRTIVVRMAVRESRRPWRREYSTENLPEGSYHDEMANVQVDLTRALATLTVKQRAIVVLRYVEDRSIDDVAQVMGIAVGTVKRQSSDAVEKLRRVLGHDFLGGLPERAAVTQPGAAASNKAPGGMR